MVAVGLFLSAQGGLAKVADLPQMPLGSQMVVETPEFDVPAPVVESSEVAAFVDSSTLPPPPPNPCAEALTWVAGAGLPLPAGVDYQCPSTQFAHQGAACWDGPMCPQRGLIAINMERLVGTGTDYLRHVVAHEVCHIVQFRAAGRSSEASADACAAAHGAPA